MKFKDYFTPKSLIYTGDKPQEKSIIKHYHFNQKEVKMTEDFIPLEGFKHYIQVIGLSDIKTIESLKTYYPVDSMTLEDIFNVTQRDKLEMNKDHLFGVFHVSYLKEEKITDDYMSLLLFKDTLISFHETKPIYLDVMHDLIHHYQDLKETSIDFVFYQILDLITDRHLDLFELLEDQTNRFEEDILETKRVKQEDFYQTRKELIKLKNYVTPVLEQLERILKEHPTFFDPKHKAYYQDLLDHLKRLEGYLIETKDIMRTLLDLDMNNQSNQMNKVMKTLTVFSAIFIPLSFLTGFFGMNFVYFEFLNGRYALEIFIGFCLLLVLVLILIFRKLKWF